MIERMDYEAIEAVEQQLDQFLEKRARESEKQRRIEAAWAESTRRVNEKRRRTNRQAWVDHHGHMNRLHLGLAAEHADKRSRLLLETAEGEG